jgi:hypothetical protein
MSVIQIMCLQKKETYFRFKTTTTYKGIIMDLEIIEILYKFGKIFALTPLSSKKKKLNGRILHFDNCHGTKSRAVVHIDPESQNCQLKLSQFFYTICACVVLKILLSRYHYAVVCNKYSQSHPFETGFEKLQTYTLCLEKNCRCFQRPLRVDDF